VEEDGLQPPSLAIFGDAPGALKLEVLHMAMLRAPLTGVAVPELVFAAEEKLL
jgi:hypothetical protein